MTQRRRLKIDILAAPDSVGSVIYGLYDALSMPGISWPRIVTGEPGEPLAEIRIVASGRKQFTCRGGVPVRPHASIAQAGDADLICVPSMSLPVDRPPYGCFPREVAWLRERFLQGATIATVCSGAILAAEAGLLNGCEATAHWAYADVFRRYYPQIKFRPERILTFAGEGNRLILAGGIAAWQDLAVHIIAKFFGIEHAAQTAKIYVFSDHAQGQLPYAAMSRRIQKDDPAIAECQVWIAENYATSNPVAQILKLSNLPQRTFNRRFEAATGYRPMEYVHAVRIEEAKQLLETTGKPIDDIAQEVGYQDPRPFSRLFFRKTGLSPASYRKRFGYRTLLSAR
ncbi:MAG: GlxA family transcriptional regulator [Alphaproteobacteria bacterium]